MHECFYTTSENMDYTFLFAHLRQILNYRQFDEIYNEFSGYVVVNNYIVIEMIDIAKNNRCIQIMNGDCS